MNRPDALRTDPAADAVSAALDALLAHAVADLGLDPEDVRWKRNRLLELLGVTCYRATGPDGSGPGPCRPDSEGKAAPDGAGCVPDHASPHAPDGLHTPDALVDRLVRALADADAGPVSGEGIFDEDGSREAVSGGGRGDGGADGAAAALSDKVMGELSPSPSATARRFLIAERERNGMAAMRFLYDLCVANGYVKRARLDANPRFDSHGLTVTINLAKPEFKDMGKAAAGNAVSGGYPACTICRENEGYGPRDKRTLRTVPVTLGGGRWFWQFSPYGYFREHGICVNEEHTPMHVDRTTFGNLMDFVERFPGYFLGCNAALPRIGGSVLAHDHYQGGGETMPMHRAGAAGAFALPGSSDAVVETLDWPGTAVRVVSGSREAVEEISERIRGAWAEYDDAARGIASHDRMGRPQSALSPSVVATGRGWEMSLILRNNAVSGEYPEGVFHAHPEYWAVKREPVGLIEAQGLFILPGRLVGQLSRLAESLECGGDLPEGMGGFRPLWDELMESLDGDRDHDAVRAAIGEELGSVCRRILRDTAVFKDRSALEGFLEEAGLRRI